MSLKDTEVRLRELWKKREELEGRLMLCPPFAPESECWKVGAHTRLDQLNREIAALEAAIEVAKP